MHKGLLLFMLFLLQLGVPGCEILVVLVSWFIPTLRIELLTQALAEQRRLERFLEKQRELRQCCPECARDLLASELLLEIKACESEIRRLRRDDLEESLRAEMLRLDRLALRNFQEQHRQLLAYQASELQTDYLEYLDREIADSKTQFLRLARAFKADFADFDLEVMSFAGGDCQFCFSGLNQHLASAIAGRQFGRN